MAIPGNSFGLIEDTSLEAAHAHKHHQNVQGYMCLATSSLRGHFSRLAVLTKFENF